MYIKPDRKFLSKLARFLLLNFIIYLVVSFFIRDEDQAFLSFANFSKMVVMGSFLGIIFTVFDRERVRDIPQAAFSKEQIKQIFFGVLLFLLISIPLFIFLYFLFSFLTNEKINLWMEFVKLGIFAVVTVVLFSAFLWFRTKLRRTNNQEPGGGI